MARALQLAKRGLYSTHPNPRVGCVIVKDDRVVGEGWHERAGEPHAEVHALKAAGDAARGADVYVTLEPCAHTGRTAPCTQALITAGVGRVVAAVKDADPRTAGQGLAQLKQAGIETQSGLLENQARQLNAGFFSRFEPNRPWVTIKLAMSLDGRTAMASGESRWITGEAARQDVQYLRARQSAILTGSGTVLSDNPRLTIRLDGEWRQPLRVVLDTHLQTPVDATLFQTGETLLLAGEGAATKPYPDNVQINTVAMQGNRLDLSAVLQLLAEQEMNEVLVEAGPTLAGAFVSAGLADEIIIYMAPHFMGHNGKPLLTLPGMENMTQRQPLKITDIRAVGEDWRITASLETNNLPLVLL